MTDMESTSETNQWGMVVPHHRGYNSVRSMVGCGGAHHTTEEHGEPIHSDVDGHRPVHGNREKDRDTVFQKVVITSGNRPCGNT